MQPPAVAVFQVAGGLPGLVSSRTFDAGRQLVIQPPKTQITCAHCVAHHPASAAYWEQVGRQLCDCCWRETILPFLTPALLPGQLEFNFVPSHPQHDPLCCGNPPYGLAPTSCVGRWRLPVDYLELDGIDDCRGHIHCGRSQTGLCLLTCLMMMMMMISCWLVGGRPSSKVHLVALLET